MNVFCLKCSSTVDHDPNASGNNQSGILDWEQEKYQQFLFDILHVRILPQSTNSESNDGNKVGPAPVAGPSNSKRKTQKSLNYVVTPLDVLEEECIFPDQPMSNIIIMPSSANSAGNHNSMETTETVSNPEHDMKLILANTNPENVGDEIFVPQHEGKEISNSSPQVGEDNFDAPTASLPGINEEFPFCTKCKKEIESLYLLHEDMTNITRKYEETRDKLAATMVDTFFQQCESIDVEHGFRGKLKNSAEVYEKWKYRYTGKAEEEGRVKHLLEEKDFEVVERERKLRRIKEESGDIGSYGAPRPYGLSAIQLAKIQRAMTVSYFTPKMNVIRRRNRLYFKVGIKPQKMDIKHICRTCSKEFPRLDTLNIHERGHFIGLRKRYKCSVCRRIFDDRKQLLQHTKCHAGSIKKIKCGMCEKIFPSVAAQRMHSKKYHTDIKYQCEICLEKFASPYLLKKHVGSHTEIDFSVTDLFSCKVCAKTFLKSNDLSDHLVIHSDDTLVGCDYCGKAFSSGEHLAEHLEVHKGDNPYLCEECDIRFSSEALMVSHLKNHRPKVHICGCCGKACRSKDGLRKHELTHTGNKPFCCDVCDTGFIERKSFEVHMIKHTGKLPYKCNACVDDEGFKDSKDLRKHRIEAHPELLLHDKSLACEFCWNTYPSAEILQEHITRTHERYKCHVCNRVFKLGDHLRRHMYIHTGEKPYKCGRCPKSFNQESNLKEHMYRHTGIRPHKCPHCDVKGYLRRIHLKEHMMKEHGTDVIPLLPMGRASQNARKAGFHPVPDPSSHLDPCETLTLIPQINSDIPVIVSTSGSNCKKPLLFRKVSTIVNPGSSKVQQRNPPIIMRNILPKKESPIYINSGNFPSSNNIITHEVGEIPTINIKSENPTANFEVLSSNTMEQQEYVIFL